MASRYWVGGTGTWDTSTTTNWSATSGGAGGVSVPTSADDVFFDASSGTGTTTLSGTLAARNVVCTGFTGTINGTSTLQSSGPTITLSSGMTLGGSITWQTLFAGTTALTSAGKTLTSITCAASNTLSQQDAMTVAGGLTANGSWNTNSFAATMSTFTSSNTNVRTLTFGSSSITCTGSTTSFTTATATNLTVTTNTATVTLNGTDPTGGFGGINWNGLTLVLSNTVGTSFVNISGANTFANLTRLGPASTNTALVLQADQVVTGTFTVTGSSAANRVNVQSNIVGTPRTITAATVSVTNADFTDIVGAGAGNWNLSAVTSGDCGGNSGITFTTAATQTRSGAGGNWSAAGNWTSRVPLPQDNVIVNSGATGTITIDMPRLGKDVDFTGFAGTATFGTTGLYGSLTFASGMTVSNTNNLTLAGRGTHTITTAGKTITMAVLVNGPGGTYTLQDAFTGTGNFTVTAGTFTANNFNMTVVALLPGGGSLTRTVNLGTSTVTMSGTGGSAWAMNGATNLTVNGASSTFVFTGAAPIWNGAAAISGTGFGTLTWASSVSGTVAMNGTAANYTITAINFIGSGTAELQANNAFTVGAWSISAGRTLRLQQGVTTTITGSLTLAGTSASPVTLRTFAAGSAATISMAAGTKVASDYVSVQDITGTGGATFTMGSRSTNVSGNTGLTFTDAPQRFWIGGTGTWDATTTTNWAVVSGGTGGLSVPTATTNVFFDANSGTGTVAPASGVVANNFDATGFTGTFNGATMAFSGTVVTLGSGMTATGFIATLQPGAGNTVSFTSNGRTVNSLNFASGTVSLVDAMTVSGNITHQAGTFTTNNFALTAGGYQSNVSTTRVITFGSSSVTITGANNAYLVASSGLTMTANTATVTMTNVAGGFNTVGGTMNGAALVWSGNTSGNIANPVVGLASLTINGTSSTKAGVFQLVGGVTTTGAFTVNGNSVTNRMLIQSNAFGSQRTITAASVSVSNADFSDIVGAGAANWDLSAATGGSGDAGGNSGISFTPSVTVYGRGMTAINASYSWSNPSIWANVSGGAAASQRIPLPQDDVRLDANSFGATGITLNQDMPRLGRNIDWTGATNTPTWSNSGGFSSGQWFFGSVTLISAMAHLGGAVGMVAAGRGSYTLTTSGRTWANTLAITAPGGTYTLADAFSGGAGIVLNNGTLNTNNMSVTLITSFTSAGTGTKSLILGTSTVSLTATTASAVWSITTTGLTLSAASSTIVISTASANTRSMSLGSGLAYGTITYTVAASTGQLNLSNGPTIGTLNVSGGARTVAFSSSVNTNITNWNVFGLVGAVVSVVGGTSGTAATLFKTSGYIASDYVSVQDITGSGGATFYMGSRSTSVSGNTGLTFTDAPQRYWVGGTGTWDASDTTHWAVVSGGTGGLAVPTATEDVYFDANCGSGTMTLGANANMKSFDATGCMGTLAGGGFRMSIYGTVFTLSSTMTLSGTFLPWSLVGGGVTTTVTTAGKALSGGLTVSNFGITQADALSVGTDQINYNSGTWTTSGFSVTADTFISSTTNTRVLTLSNSILTFSGSFSSHGWQVTGATGLTVSANTATVVLTGQSAHFTGSSAINVNGMSLSMTGSGLPQIDNAMTFANVTRTGTAVKTDGFSLVANLTVTGTLTVSGNSAVNRVLVQSNVIGTSRTITAAAVSVANADFMDIVGAGTGNWNLSSPTSVPAWTAGGTGGNLLTAADATMSSVANWMVNGSPTGSTITLDSTYGSDGTTSGLVTRGSGSGTGFMQVDEVVTRYVAATSGQYFAITAVVRNNASTARTFGTAVNGWNAGGGWLGAASLVSSSSPTLAAGATGVAYGIFRMPTDSTMAVMTPSFWQSTGVVGDTWNIDQVGVYAVTPGGSGDAGGNSGITYTTAATQTWQGTAGGNWSDVTKWTSRVPLPQDNVSMTAAFVAGQTVSADMPRMGRDIDWTGATGSPSWTTAGIAPFIFGSLTLISGMTWGTGALITFAGRGTHTITSAGKSIGNTGPVNLVGPGGTYTQQDAAVVAATFQVLAGTWVTNNFAFSALALIATGATATFNGGTSTVSLTGFSASLVIFGFTSSAVANMASTTLVIATATTNTRLMQFAGRTLGTLTYTVVTSPGALQIGSTGGWTVTTLNVGSGRTLTLPSSSTMTVTNWNVAGQDFDYLYLPGVSGNYVSTPDSAPLSITGDIDVRARAALDDWTPVNGATFISKRAAATSDISYAFRVSPGSTGLLQFVYSINGSTAVQGVSTVAPTIADGAVLWVRATRVASTGVITFYTSNDGVTWTQLGAVVNTGVTPGNLYDSVAQVEIGSYGNASADLAIGKFYRAQVFNGIGGTVVMDADFSAKPVGANTFVGSSGNTFTVSGALAQAGDGRVDIGASTPGTAATLTKGNSVLSGSDYLRLTDITATPSSTFYAGTHSVDGGGNTGWVFTDPPISGGASLTLTASGLVQGKISGTAALTLLAATATARAQANGTAVISLTAINTAVGARLTANAALVLLASVVTGYLGRRDVQVSFGLVVDKVATGTPVLYLITTGVPSI